MKNIVIVVMLIAILILGIYTEIKRDEHAQLDHQYQNAFRAIMKAHSLGIDDQIQTELEGFTGPSPKQIGKVMELVTRMNIHITKALDEKYKNRVSVYTDEIDDRNY